MTFLPFLLQFTIKIICELVSSFFFFFLYFLLKITLIISSIHTLPAGPVHTRNARAAVPPARGTVRLSPVGSDSGRGLSDVMSTVCGQEQWRSCGGGGGVRG